MTMRTIVPLNDRDWKLLVEDLKRGPTEEQKEFMRQAIKHVDTLDISDD